MSDLLPELRNEIKINHKAKTAAINEAKSFHQERLLRIVNTPLTEYNFSPGEAALQRRIEKRFQTLASQSKSDSGIFLRELENTGVVIINTSQYLEYLRRLRVERGRFDPDRQETQAVYVTNEDILSFFERFKTKLPEDVQQELEQVTQGKNGVIFLGNNPPALVQWHEGTHAIQHLEGWNFRNSGKYKTEMGVNIIVLKAHEDKILGGVSSGDYYVHQDGFSKPIVVPKTNDIYKELEDFERNAASRG
ncbi:hypothetical protein HYW46_01565 [Candidatus Daviesbacteria bacterium]|nr:hypothetical protein [Candidatus Daviesbacteria bacterium]